MISPLGGLKSEKPLPSHLYSPVEFHLEIVFLKNISSLLVQFFAPRTLSIIHIRCTQPKFYLAFQTNNVFLQMSKHIACRCFLGMWWWAATALSGEKLASSISVRKCFLMVHPRPKITTNNFGL